MEIDLKLAWDSKNGSGNRKVQNQRPDHLPREGVTGLGIW